MEDRKEKRNEIARDVAQALGKLSAEELEARRLVIEDKLFEFANFMESKLVLFYLDKETEVPMRKIIERAQSVKKQVILPAFDVEKQKVSLMKVDDMGAGLKSGPKGLQEPDPARCKAIPLDQVDIAIIPGYAFDEKGGRIGAGEGYYDKLITKLPPTTRKIAVAFEEQVVPQIPMPPRHKHVDIIITDKRTIYKI